MERSSIYDKFMRFLGKYGRYVYIFTDLLITFVFTILTFRGMYGAKVFATYTNNVLIYASALAALIVLLLCIFREYKVVSSQFSVIDAVKLASIILGAEIVGLLVLFFTPDSFIEFHGTQVWIWAFSTVTLIFVLPTTRLLTRLYRMLKLAVKRRGKCFRTVIIGAGDSARVILDDATMNPESKRKVVALVDDDPRKIGSVMSNISIKGPISNVSKIVSDYQAEEVIIAIPSLSKDDLQKILNYLAGSNCRVKRMPVLSEMAGPNDKRIIDVNIDDLLCRDPILLDNHEILPMLQGKTVLVTGAGGSIGSELVRQIFKCHPATLVLFDIYENSTYDIQMELTRRIRNEHITDVNLVTLIGSTYNAVRVEQIMNKYRPDYIYHAAAYKHVPLMEDSPAEAIRTNVIGTYNVARLADKYGVKKMVLVSTDKAVRPTNAMGATKRFAETIIQYFASKSEHTAYAAVRFGNVLGSNGSVVPLFKKQIEEGGPVTITDRNIIRYFMTIPEAVSLILQCGLYATGGEIFILDMGEPVKIINLAERLIRQAGLVPGVDIKIMEIGLRPGEKLYEELLVDRSHQTKTANKRIFIEPKSDVYPIEEEIQEISKVFDMDSVPEVKKMLASIITTYSPDNK